MENFIVIQVLEPINENIQEYKKLISDNNYLMSGINRLERLSKTAVKNYLNYFLPHFGISEYDFRFIENDHLEVCLFPLTKNNFDKPLYKVKNYFLDLNK